MFQIDQGGLGLPERQYYLNESDKKVNYSKSSKNDYSWTVFLLRGTISDT